MAGPRAPRVVIAAAALLSFLTLPAHGQRYLGGPDAIPDLLPGLKVRVWTWEGAPRALLPYPTVRIVRITGVLTSYAPPDSLSLRRRVLIRPPWQPPEYTAMWVNVGRIDVPNGRDVLGGTARGAGVALSAGLGMAFLRLVFCEHGCALPSPLETSAYVAVVTVPAGALLGFFSTRWKRVY